MSTGSFDTTIELVINGYSCERPVTIRYEYERAGGDGWNEPRYPERATVYEVILNDEYAGSVKTQRDLFPFLTKEVLASLEADCCEHEANEREYAREQAADMRRDAQWERV